jgi:transcriptional regulator with XRE-family HTH domain
MKNIMETNITGKNIRRFRKLRFYSQEKLAKLMGKKSYTTVQKWESGIIEPPMSTLTKLASVLGVSIQELTTDEDSISIVSTSVRINVYSCVHAGVPS